MDKSVADKPREADEAYKESLKCKDLAEAIARLFCRLECRAFLCKGKGCMALLYDSPQLGDYTKLANSLISSFTSVTNEASGE